VLLGLEWPWQIVGGLTAGVSVTYDGYTYQLLNIGFEVDDYSTDGPFLFSLVTPAWRLAYRATFEPDGLTYTPLADDAEVASRPSPVPMCAWINRNKPTLFLDGDRMITAEDRLLAPGTDLPPFNRDRLKAINWLFDRSRRQITRTPDGQAFVPHAVRPDPGQRVGFWRLAEAEEAFHRVDLLTVHGPQGTGEADEGRHACGTGFLGDHRRYPGLAVGSGR
jgi:hypothetical protein